MVTLAWFYIVSLLVANSLVGALSSRTNNLLTDPKIRSTQRRSVVNTRIGLEALTKILRQTRLLYTNGYDKVFIKTGGYKQAISDFQSIYPKVLQGNIQRGEMMGSKGNLILKVSKKDGDSPIMSIEIHKLYRKRIIDPPAQYTIFYNGKR